MKFSDVSSTLIDLGVDSSRLSLIEKYCALLWEENQNLNLLSRQMTIEDFLKNHLVDCFLPLKKFPLNIKNVADFGSGGGMPGVLYALQFPHMQFHLFEKSPKKQLFLEKCKELAANIIIHGEIVPEKMVSIDLVMARAFKPLEVILELSRVYYAQGGKYFLLKGRTDKIQEEFIDAQKKFKNLRIKKEPLFSPFVEAERNLVTIGMN